MLRISLLILTIALSAPLAATLEAAIAERVAECERFEHGEPERAIELADTLLQEELSQLYRSRTLACQAWALASIGRVTEARVRIDEQIQLARQLEPAMDRASQLQRAASASYRSGAVEQALELISEARAIAEAENLSELMPAIVGHLAIYQGDAGQLDLAIDNYHRALDLLEASGDQARRVPLSYNLGLTYRQAGRFEEALAELEPLLPMLAAPGMEIRRASLLAMLGGLHMRLGDLAQAAELFEQSEALHEQLDNPAEYAALLRDRAALSAELGKLETALAQSEIALAAAQRSGDNQSINASLITLVNKLAATGEFERALQLHRELLERSERSLRDQLSSRLAEMEAQLGLQRQALELEQLRQDRTIQTLALEQQQWRNRLTRLGVLALLTLALAMLIWQRQNNQRLRRISRSDALTGLPNRRALTADLRPLARKSGGGAGVLFLLDLDHFKLINDIHGHDSGDRALVATAASLRRFADRHHGQVGRWGGEEFAIYLDDQSSESAEALAAELIDSIKTISVKSLNGEPISLSASLGFAPLDATRPHSGQEAWEPALNCADQLLYRAKKAGRNGWFGVWPATEEQILEPLELDRQIESGECRLLSG